jgi:hypothetical protein
MEGYESDSFEDEQNEGVPQTPNEEYSPNTKKLDIGVFDINSQRWREICEAMYAEQNFSDTLDPDFTDVNVRDNQETQAVEQAATEQEQVAEPQPPQLEVELPTKKTPKDTLPKRSLEERMRSLIEAHQLKINTDTYDAALDTPEALSTYTLPSSKEKSKAYYKTREELTELAAQTKPDEPLKKRLILAWSSFAPRIAKKNGGSEDVLPDIKDFLANWYSGSLYIPFRHSREDAWVEAIDRFLPVEIIGQRSFVFSLEHERLPVRIRQGWEYHKESVLRATEKRQRENMHTIDAIYEQISFIERLANDFFTEFIITPSRTTSAGMISIYEKIYRNAIRQWHTFEEAVDYKHHLEEIRNEIVKSHPTIQLPEMRPISAMYSERSSWSPQTALMKYAANGILPYLDLSEMKEGITTKKVISLPNKPTKRELIPWQDVFKAIAWKCPYVVVRGDPNEFRGEKRELYRTLISPKGATKLAEKLEFLVNETRFNGKFVLAIDPLITQMKGGKALSLDRFQTYLFYDYIKGLENEKKLAMRK